MVVINGFATTAGSRWNFFAHNGKMQPTSFENIIVINIDSEIINADIVSTPGVLKSKPSSNKIFPKHKIAKEMPINMLTLNSFHITFNVSLNSISLSAIPLMIVADA